MLKRTQFTLKFYLIVTLLSLICLVTAGLSIIR